MLFFFLMIRRPPRSTLLSLHDALPICRVLPRVPRAQAALHAAPAAAGAVLHELPAPRDRVADDAVRERRSEEHTSELQSRQYLVCRLLLEKKNIKVYHYTASTNTYGTP